MAGPDLFGFARRTPDAGAASYIFDTFAFRIASVLSRSALSRMNPAASRWS
jgi:hypothetical protein